MFLCFLFQIYIHSGATLHVAILYWPYLTCWCPGDLRRQGISRHGIDQISQDIPSRASDEFSLTHITKVDTELPLTNLVIPQRTIIQPPSWWNCWHRWLSFAYGVVSGFPFSRLIFTKHCLIVPSCAAFLHVLTHLPLMLHISMNESGQHWLR